MDSKQLLMLVGGILVIAAIALLLLPKVVPAAGGGQTVDAAYVDRLQMGMDAGSIPELKDIISRDYDSYTRERAVIALCDISAVKGDPEDAISFLKGVAFNEPDENVRIAAFTGIGMLREQNPAPISGTLDVQAFSDFKPNSTIDFAVAMTSNEGSGDVVIFLDSFRAVTDGGYIAADMEGSPSIPYYLSLGPGETRVVHFNATVAEPGEYVVAFKAKVGLDRADYRTFRQDVGLSISESGGSYALLETD